MAYSSEKFNHSPKPDVETPQPRVEVPCLPEFVERKKPLTENERRILDNIIKTVAWFDKELKDLNDKRLDRNLAAYINDSEKGPAQIERPAEESEILESAIKSDIVFLGDYHHLSKSQDFVAQIIEQISQRSAAPFVLAIEFVERSKSGQEALDDYLSEKISEEEFLKKIKFRNWGNPEHWPAYKHILESAKKSGVKVYGINTDRKEKTLSGTDKKIAANLRKIAQQNPESRVLVHIGEDHLSENHLPKELSALDEFKQKKSITIFQNLSSVYFDALKKYKDFHIPKSFKLQSQSLAYSLVTAPLITKLVADIEYLQLKEDPEDDIEFLTTDTSYELVKRMVNTLKLRQRKDKYDTVPPIFSSKSGAERIRVFKKSGLVETFRPYFEILEQKGSVYIPGSKDGRRKLDAALIIKKFRLKKVLEELAKFIANPDKKIEDFAQLSPAEQKNLRAFQYLCSKVFVPERTPSNDEEELGEQIFVDFLNGKMIEMSRV